MKKTKTSEEFVSAIEARLSAGVMPVERALSDEAAEIAEAYKAISKAEAQRPDISRLPDAVVGGVPRVVVGDRIVIERRASFLAGNPYLDTRTYRIRDIDLVSGKLSLWDEALDQFAVDNFVKGEAAGQVYKMANGMRVSTRKKRGRPRKGPISAEASKPVELDAAGNPIKKKRGRPAGVKNRTKAEIAADKEAKRAERSARAARRARIS